MIMPATEGDSIRPEETPTPSASHLSSQTVTASTATLTPSWTPPKSPLPPHRLAKIANALGVSTPLPAIHYSMSLSPPFSGLNRSHTDLSESRRSPTLSSPGASFQPYTPTISKFLLHVIPPKHLPHDTDNDDSMFTPFPSSVNGYHTQFRRGVLVPLYASLQLQLGAIAREYALPSTAGIILYLVSSARVTNSRGISDIDAETDEPGPRLSEEVWRHLWMRVMKAEQRDDHFSLSPKLPQLPSSPIDAPLRPFLSNATPPTNGLLPQPMTPHLPPSPSTPSTASDLRSLTKSAPPSILSQSDREADTPTPDTSAGEESRANSLDLPGLALNSIMPVLAKVEFDIDGRKAVWYDRWLRSRKVNHAKRAEGRKGSVNRQACTNEEEGQGREESDDADEKEKKKHISLLIGRKTASPVSFILSPAAEQHSMEEAIREKLPDEASSELELELDESAEAGTEETGYQQLSGGDAEDDANNESDDEFTSEITARVTSVNNRKDPLADVFGTDEDTWAEMHDISQGTPRRQTNPNFVDLALNAADLTHLPSPTQSETSYLEEQVEEQGVDEVKALLDQMSKGQEDVPPSKLTQSQRTPNGFPERKSSLTYGPVSSASSLGAGGRKHIPAPLVLVPAKSTMQELEIPTEPSPMGSSSNGSIRLAYLRRNIEDDALSPRGLAIGEDGDDLDDEMRLRTPAEYEKREAVVWDEDLDLDIGPAEEYDENDPNDRRRSQLMMKAQLDEIERTMASLSPRNFQAELEGQQQKSPMGMTLTPNNSLPYSPALLNQNIFPPSIGQNERTSPIKQVNFANDPINYNRRSPSSLRPGGSPPRLIVNGSPNNVPSLLTPRSSNDIQGGGSPQPLRSALKTLTSTLSTESPIIPLSPDPFGRFASDPPQQSAAYWDNPPDTVHILPEDDPASRAQSRATSRFSLDSSAGEETKEVKVEQNPPKPSLVSVSSLKKFWRRGTKSPVAIPSVSPPLPSPGSATPLLQPSRRPSQDPPDLPPKAPVLGQFPTQLLPTRPSQERELSTSAAQRSDEPPKTPSSGQFLPFPGSPRSPQQVDPPHPQPQLVLPDQQRQQLPPDAVNRPGYDLYSGSLIGGNSSQRIHAAHMQRTRKNSTLEGPEFDQEVPYPIHPSPSIPRTQLPAISPQPAAPGLHEHQPQPSMSNPYLASPSSLEPPLSPQPPSPLVPEKPSLRKSILKSWKSSTSLNSPQSQQPPQMPSRPSISVDRLPSIAPRPRRTSVSHSPKNSVSSTPTDYPPSPQIPQQFLQNGTRRQSVRSRLTGSSIDSSQSLRLSAAPGGDSGSLRRSVASSQSRDSRDSRPSFDASQFEIVSPRPPISPPAHQAEHQQH